MKGKQNSVRLGTMGHVGVKVRIGDPDRIRVIDGNALVDIGATVTVIPRKIANELNLKTAGRLLLK